MSDTKTIRSFQCRDHLWQKFEEMAVELECSVDYLVNDAMKQYARQRGYGSTKAGGPPPPSRTSLQPPANIPASQPSGAPPPPPEPPPPPPAPAAAAPPPPPPPPPAAARKPPPPGRRSAGAPPVGGRGHSPPPPPPPPRRPSPPPPPPGGGRAAPPPPPPARGAPPPPRQRTLHLYYNNEAFPIAKDRFIIGRGKQTTDLTIKDPNVSRQHAMVEYMNGKYYIVDMGSTNGVEFGGKRVQRQVVNEGDTFRVCDHELRFTYA